MKKTNLLLLLLAVMMVGVTGCNNSKKYSFYTIQAIFPYIDENNKDLIYDNMTDDQKDMYNVQTFVNNYINRKGYVKTAYVNGVIYFENTDETYNDEQAMKVYAANLEELRNTDWDEVIKDALKANTSVTLNSMGSTFFTYTILKGSIGSSMPNGNATITILYDYSPVAPE